MIQIIAGEKGKGKTKVLLDKVNVDIKDSKGSIVYLDKSNKHMYELNNQIRLINVRDYFVEDKNGFVGFVCGLISGNHDLQKIYMDSFLKVACVEEQDLEGLFSKLDLISAKYQVDFIISISLNASDLPASVQSNVIVSL